MSAIHPDDVEKMKNYWVSVLASGSPAETEARLRRADGEYRWFLFRANPLRDESGKAVQWYGTNTDIEDLKRAADAVRASELSFRLIVHSIPGLVATMTPRGDVELVNQPLLDYTGLPFDGLKDWSAKGLVRADDWPRWKQSVETGCEYDVEHRLRRTDGTYRWFHVRGLPLRDNQGLVIRWYCVVTDIEERKRTEEPLRASEVSARLILNSIPGLVCTTTAVGAVELVSQPILDYTGKTLEEVKNWPSVIHEDDRKATIELWRRSIETGLPFNTEFRVRRADRVYRWFDARAHPLRDADGHVIRWYGLYTDIEDRKQVEQALRASELNLREEVPLHLNEVIGEVLRLLRVRPRRSASSWRPTSDKTWRRSSAIASNCSN